MSFKKHWATLLLLLCVLSLSPQVKEKRATVRRDENYFYDHIMDVTEFYNKGVKTSAGNMYTLSPYHVLWPIALKAISTNVQGHINQTPGYDGSETNIEPIDRPNE